jgi:hypothetical protein
VGPTPKHAGARRPLQLRTEGWNEQGRGSRALLGRLATVDTAARSSFRRPKVLFVSMSHCCRNKKLTSQSVSVCRSGLRMRIHCVRVSSDGFCALRQPQARRGKGRLQDRLSTSVSSGACGGRVRCGAWRAGVYY